MFALGLRAREKERKKEEEKKKQKMYEFMQKALEMEEKEGPIGGVPQKETEQPLPPANKEVKVFPHIERNRIEMLSWMLAKKDEEGKWEEKFGKKFPYQIPKTLLCRHLKAVAYRRQKKAGKKLTICILLTAASISLAGTATTLFGFLYRAGVSAEGFGEPSGVRQETDLGVIIDEELKLLEYYSYRRPRSKQTFSPWKLVGPVIVGCAIVVALLSIEVCMDVSRIKEKTIDDEEEFFHYIYAAMLAHNSYVDSGDPGWVSRRASKLGPSLAPSIVNLRPSPAPSIVNLHEVKPAPADPEPSSPQLVPPSPLAPFTISSPENDVLVSPYRLPQVQITPAPSELSIRDEEYEEILLSMMEKKLKT
ncbi:unnamed protein product [Darwinula stevensoni]|uniref:Uncharacterized protein n=1 Tax=Darwinula stevensoni TaxID=69355 RepID=A0A7R8X3A2_9CRUS|nr:unnamed protein product [Darwinula stevensoni]CAG0884171.1 unnamed protein product [Darwinula stevensoni]